MPNPLKHPSEHAEQVRLMTWARLAANTRPELKRLMSIPNGGKRSSVTGQHMKAEGVAKGYPDLQLMVPRGGYHGLMIEMKAMKGRLSPEQEDWLGWLNSQGYYAVMCKGWAQAREVIESYLEGAAAAPSISGEAA